MARITTLILGTSSLGDFDQSTGDELASRSLLTQEQRIRVAAFLMDKKLEVEFLNLAAGQKYDDAIGFLKEKVGIKNTDLKFDRREVISIYDLFIERRSEIEAVLARFKAGDDDLFDLREPGTPSPILVSDTDIIDLLLEKTEWTTEDIMAIANNLWKTHHGSKILELSNVPGDSVSVVKTYILTDLVEINEGYRRLTEGENPERFIAAILSAASR